MSEYRKVEMLPEHMREAVIRYMSVGFPPGRFLTAVFSNELVETYGFADDENTEAMKKWAAYLYLYAPPLSWGSRAKVREWVANGGLLGMQEKAAKRKAALG
jgi:hypothetical protein